MSPYRKNDLVLIEHIKLNNDKYFSPDGTKLKAKWSPELSQDLNAYHGQKLSDRYRLTGFGGRCSLAMVLDTKPKISYVVYVAGKGSEVKFDPFWIDNECLIPYGDSHEFGHHHGWHESPTK